MCGIIGFIDNQTDRNNIKSYFTKQKHRGEDSYGALIQQNKTITSYKYLSLDDFDKNVPSTPLGSFFLAHHRKASVGGKTVELAHPIMSANKQVVLIHNGTKKAIYETIKLANSDTEAIAEILSYHFKADTLIQSLLQGAGIIIAKENTGNVLFFSDGGRCLYINKERTKILSEPFIEGTWYLVKPQCFVAKSFTDMLTTLKTYADKPVVIAENSILRPIYCKACERTHFHQVGKDVCIECDILGKKPIAKPSIYGATYYHRNYWDGLMDYEDDVPTVPIWADIGEKYEFSTNGKVWVKSTLVEIDRTDASKTYKYWNNSIGCFVWCAFIRKIIPTAATKSDSIPLPYIPLLTTCRGTNDDGKTWKYGTYVSYVSIAKRVYTLKDYAGHRFEVSKIEELPTTELEEDESYEFSNDGYHWETRIFQSYNKKASFPYLTASVNGVNNYRYVRIPNKPKYKIGKSYIFSIDAETWEHGVLTQISQAETRYPYKYQTIDKPGITYSATYIKEKPLVTGLAAGDTVEYSSDGNTWHTGTVAYYTAKPSTGAFVKTHATGAKFYRYIRIPE